jgi:hypothetical protein
MKLTLSRFLVENEGRTPNISVIKNNLAMCVEKQKFIYRGSENGDDFGEKEQRASRPSLTNSNIVLNFTSLYFDHLPSRKKSYFGTNSPIYASDFGEVFVLIPHDNVEKFAIVEEDFNLRENPVLSNIKAGMDFSSFGYAFAESIFNICRVLRQESDKHAALENAIDKIHNNHEEIKKSDFEAFDEAFRTAFSDNVEQEKKDPAAFYAHGKLAYFVWELVSSKYDGSFIRFMKDTISHGTSQVKMASFSEILDTTNHNELFEIWFEGRCSYFRLSWIEEQLGIDYGDEDYSISDEVSEEEDYDVVLAKFFKRFV